MRYHVSAHDRMKKLISAVCIAVFFAVQTAFCNAAAPPEIIDELFALNMTERGAESFFDGLQLGNADMTAFCYGRLYGAEGTVIANNADAFTQSAKRAADELVNSESFVTPTELQRTAVLLSAFGECSRELINAASYSNPNLDKQGLNAWIWALTAANCSGIEPDDGAVYTRSRLAEELIGRQLEDGGFALRGTAADADITAAAITALAPLGDNENVQSALDKAVCALSAIQLENGGFTSLGAETSESTAQAIIAFTAAGVSDERLDRAVSALLRFRTEDGGFAHEPDGKPNKMAASQALQAFTALELSKRGERLFDKPQAVEGTGSLTSEAPETSNISEFPEIPEKSDISDMPESSAETAGIADKNGLTGFHIKLIISGALAAVGLTLVIAGIARRKKRAVITGTAVLILSGAVWLLNIRTPAEYYAQTTENAITVRVGADCSDASANLGDIDESVNPLSVIPEDGVILPLGEVGLPEGATAFDALIEAARASRVRVDYVGSSYGVYIRGIGFVYEFGFGSGSGWTYRVNGEVPQMSAGAYELSDGDTVEFVYKCEPGQYRENAD